MAGKCSAIGCSAILRSKNCDKCQFQIVSYDFVIGDRSWAILFRRSEVWSLAI